MLKLLSSAGSKVATFIRTDVTKYVDNKALFQHAESEFGGVDVSERKGMRLLKSISRH